MPSPRSHLEHSARQCQDITSQATLSVYVLYFTPSKQSRTLSAMEYDWNVESRVHKILPEHEAINVELNASYCRFFFGIQLSLIINEALNTAFPMVNLGDMSALRSVVRFPTIAYPLIKYHPYGSCDPDTIRSGCTECSSIQSRIASSRRSTLHTRAGTFCK